MLPPPLLYFGLNNMYTENYTNWQLSLPYEEIVGGLHLDAKDAIRIGERQDTSSPRTHTLFPSLSLSHPLSLCHSIAVFLPVSLFVSFLQSFTRAPNTSLQCATNINTIIIAKTAS